MDMREQLMMVLIGSGIIILIPLTQRMVYLFLNAYPGIWRAFYIEVFMPILFLGWFPFAIAVMCLIWALGD